MFREHYKGGSEGMNFDAIEMHEHEIMIPKFKGKVFDRIFDAVTGELIKEIDWDNNIVVANASVLIASLIAQASGYTGATWWAVGSGSSSWDTTPATPNSTDTQLVAEVFRKQIPAGSIVFTDANGNVVTGPTNNIQIQLTFGSTDANFALREFAIYGGNATSTANSGLMINHKIHPVINKTSAISLQRTLRFTF